MGGAAYPADEHGHAAAVLSGAEAGAALKFWTSHCLNNACLRGSCSHVAASAVLGRKAAAGPHGCKVQICFMEHIQAEIHSGSGQVRLLYAAVKRLCGGRVWCAT